MGQIGSAFVEIVAKSNVKPGIAQAKKEAEQQAKESKVYTQEETDAGAAILRAQIAARHAGNTPNYDYSRKAATVLGTQRTDEGDMDRWRAERIRRPHDEGEIQQRRARLYETDSGRSLLAKQLQQDKLVHDAQRRIDFERMRVSSGAFSANLTRATDTLKPFALGITGGVGVAAALSGLAMSRISGYAAIANPTQGWRSEQASRDVGGAIGRSVMPLAEAWTEEKRKFADAIINLGLTKPDPGWKQAAQKHGLGAAGAGAGVLAGVGYGLAVGSGPPGWAAMAALAAGGYLTGRGAQNIIEKGSALKPGSSMGIGGFERLGQHFGDEADMWNAFQSAASRSPADNPEVVKVLEQIRDKLPGLSGQIQEEGWKGFKEGMFDKVLNFGPDSIGPR